MTDYTQAELDALISCAKTISDPPRRTMRSESRHRRNDMALTSQDGASRFRVFMRQSLEFAEDFSIGLEYQPPDGRSFILLRMNGQHDVSDNPQETRAHFLYHIHRALAEQVNQTFYNSIPARPTDRYASFEEAIIAFFREVGITEEPERHFPELVALPLFRSREP